MNPHSFDLFLLIMFAVFYGFGFRRGFIWQIAGIASLIVGHIAAGHLMPHIQEIVGKDPGLAHFGAWIGVYVGAAVAVYLIAWRFRKFLEKQDLAELDKHLGGLTGLLKGGLLLAVITLLTITVSQTARNGLLETKTGPVVASLAKYFENYLPLETLKALEPFYLTGEEREFYQQQVRKPARVKEKDKSFFELPPWFKNLTKKSDKIKKAAARLEPALKKVSDELPIGVTGKGAREQKPDRDLVNGQVMPNESAHKRPGPESESGPELDHESMLEKKDEQPYDPFEYEPFDPK
jgi:membrane protein required for colicin V production